MRFLHTSDWHLGAMDGDRYLFEDQEYFIDRICGIIEDKSVDAVLLAGDIYDRSVASAEAVKLYTYAMTRMCGELGVKVISVAGNHDSAERLSACSELLESAGLYITGTAEKEPRIVSFDDTDVYCLPWITEEKVKSLYPDRKDEIESLGDAYRIVTDGMRGTFRDGKRRILVSHSYAADTETSESDRAAVIGTAMQIGTDVFDGFDYVALGHLHKPQDVGQNARYSGTPMPYSFGKEETQEKSVTIIDTVDMSRETVPLGLLHRRTSLTGTLEELLHPDVPEDVINGYVKLQITDCYVGLEALSELRQVYPNCLSAAGKSYESEGSGEAMTMEEFEKIESDPVEIFKHFCLDEIGKEADAHRLDLFRAAVVAVEGDEE